jgi:hypothetical protein
LPKLIEFRPDPIEALIFVAMRGIGGKPRRKFP